jgi:hypothetical protein
MMATLRKFIDPGFAVERRPNGKDNMPAAPPKAWF